ncbi:beta-1,6-N-acetylglucosaminyltransferase [Pseudidiomarina insulisalsae]|uniref:beta-1,6-N-acetylglucosaminyltransferase n=1 Tax=Pseudidiomarina insulisalsae TaxID=575789 RepID=UPI0013009739|nr:beta-1,6-N-acetylglucosaminyltransferase [Pseudidiomarina insulisalsae]
MKKIFLIAAHKPTRALQWTVEYLSQFPENTIVIHYDAKSNVEQLQLPDRVNIRFIADPIAVQWGHFSQIEASLKLFRYANSLNYDYCFLISGECVPACSNQMMDKLLIQNQGKDFVHFQQDKTQMRRLASERIRYRYPSAFFHRPRSIIDKLLVYSHRYLRHLWFTNHSAKRNLTGLTELYKGTSWVTLTQSTVADMLRFIDNNPALVKSFEASLCGDEVFFHSVIKALPDTRFVHNPKYQHQALRYLDWQSGPQFPRHLTPSDIGKIRSGTYFFARKVTDDLSENDFEHFVGLVNDKEEKL